jgi:hypothetical protein
MKKILLSVLLSLFVPVECFSLDIDDEIQIDDSISSYHEMGDIKKNVKFVVRDKMSKAYSRINIDSISYNQNDFASVGSVILGAGSVVHGDIIIIDQSIGDKTAISTR